jgi:hypothetical protein
MRATSVDCEACCAGRGSRRGHWVEGEVIAFRDAAEAWPPLDAWEDFAPGKPAFYPRVVVPVEIVDPQPGESSLIAAWAYVASSAPAGSVPLEQ